jgi:methionine-rich copper-binding protein CopC
MARVIVLRLAMLALASPASAHARVERANPPVDGQVSASPPELSITFTEGVEPLFSTIEVRNAKGAEVSTGSPTRRREVSSSRSSSNRAGGCNATATRSGVDGYAACGYRR